MESRVPHTVVSHIGEHCNGCDICVRECSFLQEYGSPKELALRWLAAKGGEKESSSFECSLCGLCAGVCPKGLNPSEMLLTMRRELVTLGQGNFREHKAIRAYERRGSSALFSYYSLPKNCTTILFPGCALPGSRPETFRRLFQFLQQRIPALGLVLDCCSKPSHDLGNSSYFQKMFSEICDILSARSITKVLVACPNCHRIFKEYGRGLTVKTIYEELAESGKFTANLARTVTVHDPCGVRFVESVQHSVRTLLQQQGAQLCEMKHNRKISYCCGEGGSAGFLRPDFAAGWTGKRVAEAGDEVIISYCAGCTNFLGRSTETWHLLDLLFAPQALLAGELKVSRSPVTYWNRYRLKQRLRKESQAGICGTRVEMLSK